MRYLSFLKNDRPALGNIVPCTEAQVQQLEQHLGHPLPLAYREYLLLLGRDSGELLTGTHVSFDDLPQLRYYAQKMLKEHQSHLALLPTELVFLMHQGYQFMFISCQEGDDPPVHYFNECEPQTRFVALYSSFSEFIEEQYAAMKRWS